MSSSQPASEPVGDATSRQSDLCCLGRIEELVLGNGDMVVTRAFSEVMQKRAKEAPTPGGGAGTSSSRTREPDGAGQGPLIRRVRIRWNGNRRMFDTTGILSCRLTGTLEELDLTDEVPRSKIFYEEPAPGAIRFKSRGELYSRSLKHIMASAPQAVSELLFESAETMKVSATHEAIEQIPTIAPHRNHAGFHIDNQPALHGEEQLWEATLQEVKGFVWKKHNDVLNDDPALYHEVKGIRRWNGNLWAAVQTSAGDWQYDHMLDDVRRQMFSDRVGKVLRDRRVKGPPPLMLSWSRFERSTMTIDFDLVATNLDYYLKRMASSTVGPRCVVVCVCITCKRPCSIH